MPLLAWSVSVRCVNDRPAARFEGVTQRLYNFLGTSKVPQKCRWREEEERRERGGMRCGSVPGCWQRTRANTPAARGWVHARKCPAALLAQSQIGGSSDCCCVTQGHTLFVTLLTVDSAHPKYESGLAWRTRYRCGLAGAPHLQPSAIPQLSGMQCMHTYGHWQLGHTYSNLLQLMVPAR